MTRDDRVHPSPVIRDLCDGDRPWADALLDAEYGGSAQARRGGLVETSGGPALVACAAAAPHGPVGLLAYRLDGDTVEIVVLHAAVRHRGVGTALLDALAATFPGREIWLVTTNDNLDALRFYQRRGFRIRSVAPGAADDARRTLKPSIPTHGAHGIAVRDEIELVLER